LGSGFKWVEPVGCEVVLIWFGLRNQLIWCGLVTVSGGVGWSGLINCVCYIWMELDTIWFPAHLQAAVYLDWSALCDQLRWLQHFTWEGCVYLENHYQILNINCIHHEKLVLAREGQTTLFIVPGGQSPLAVL
jgi:hypothetical protein